MASEVGHASELLHSPPTPDATRRRPAIVTVDDLKSKTCWVCQEDDADSDSEQEVKDLFDDQTGTSKKSKKTGRGRTDRFVHPCSCTLVAHERCLLHWINRKSTPAQPTVKCPQCAHPYRLISPTPSLLHIFERTNSHLSRIVWTGVAALVGTAVGYACYGYGWMTMRVWMGREVSNKLEEARTRRLTSDLILIPIGLVISRLPGLDTEVCLLTALWCLPTWLGMSNRITAPSLSSLTGPAATTRYAIRIDSSAGSDFIARCLSLVFPPGPAICLHFVACMARRYRVERHHLRASLFQSLIHKARLISGRERPRSAGGRASSHNDGSQQRFGPRLATQRPFSRHSPSSRYTRVVLLGPGEPHHVDTDDQVQPPPLGTEAVVDADSTESAAVSIAQGPYGMPCPSRVMYVSPLSIARLFLTALGTPFAASATGWALQQVAMWLKPGNWLERFLAISAFRKLPAATTVAEAAARAAASSSTTAMYHGVPSLHWRNTVGLGVWVVASDVVSTIYRYLRLRRRTKMTVQNRPFVGAIVDSLELKGYDEAA